MKVSVAEFKSGIDQYLELAGDEEIVITRNGEIVAMLVPPVKSKAAIIRSLCGTLPSTATVEEARAERLAKHENHL